MTTSLSKTSSKQLRDNILFCGIIILFLFLVFSIFWADYVYYKVNFRELGLPPAKLSGRILTPEDIDEVVSLLDKRSVALQDTLQKK
ncbi:MAG: hypothetical protein Q8R29_01445 [bacterium]|nr:hypothetical protein [bacterium]